MTAKFTYEGRSSYLCNFSTMTKLQLAVWDAGRLDFRRGVGSEEHHYCGAYKVVYRDGYNNGTAILGAEAEMESDKLTGTELAAWRLGHDHGYRRQDRQPGLVPPLLGPVYHRGYDVGKEKSQPVENHNSMSAAVKARLVSTHNEGLRDGLQGTTSRNALHQRATYENAAERELYWKGWEAGNLIRHSAGTQGAD